MTVPGWLVVEVARFVSVAEGSSGLRGSVRDVLVAVRRWYEGMVPQWVEQGMVDRQNTVRLAGAVDRVARALLVALRAEREG